MTLSEHLEQLKILYAELPKQIKVLIKKGLQPNWLLRFLVLVNYLPKQKIYMRNAIILIIPKKAMKHSF